jgi:hypothetical protein
MSLSKYAIVNIINYLETTVKDQDKSDQEKLYIEPVIIDGDRSVLFRTDSGISATSPTYNKKSGDLLDKCVAVNLYEFYNIVKCSDDIINLTIRGEHLVASSYYSEYDEFDQLEVDLKILESYEPNPSNTVDLVISKAEFKLTVINKHYINNHLNLSDNIEELNVSRVGGKLYLTTLKDGVSISLLVKDITVEEDLPDFSFNIHSYFIRLIFTSGTHDTTTFKICNDGLKFDMDNYTGNMPITFDGDAISIPDELNDDSKFMVIEGDSWVSFSTLITRLTMGKDHSNLSIIYADDHHCDYSVNYGDFNIAMRNQAAMLRDGTITFDSRLFHALTKDFDIDAFTLYFEDGIVKMKVEDGAVIKYVEYDHKKYVSSNPPTEWNAF